MDSEALLTFLTVHRAGGITRAADELGRTQPAISRRLALLEAELGVPLFERTREGTVLSQAGDVLVPYAEKVNALLSDAAEAVDEFLSDKAGPVSLAVVGTLAGASLGTVLKAFSASCPLADLSLRTATSDEVSEQVRQGVVAIGLRYFDDRSPDLETVLVGSEKLVVVCAPMHPLAGKKVKSLRDLEHEHWLSFPNHFERRDASTENLFAQFLVRGVPSVDWSPVDSLTAQKRLAEAGYGLGFLTVGSVEEELQAGLLSSISVTDLDAGNPIFAVVRKKGFLSSATRELLALLKTGFGSEE
ncbi:LysR family transcriptional regulator [Parvibaculaceae bacterium PLY_AMNH_Bact1]|nr:LysR family transcriptional regulator [Parvibaculaceae bacterium PLY_AMNH_Bact1]